MNIFRHLNLIVVAVFCLLYVIGELLGRSYIDSLILERERHSFNRVLWVSTQASPGFSSADVVGLNQREVLTQQDISWLKSNDNIEDVIVWKSTVVDVKIGKKIINNVNVFEVDEKFIRAFDLGDFKSLDNGSVLISDKSTEFIEAKIVDALIRPAGSMTYSLASDDQKYLPMISELMSKWHPVQMERVRVLSPPGLSANQMAAYINIDAGLIPNYIGNKKYAIIVKSETKMNSARSEIESYFLVEKSKNVVRPVLLSTDEAFPLIVTIDEAINWMLSLRIFLFVGFIGIGLGYTWIHIKEYNFKIALYRVFGLTSIESFLKVYMKPNMRIMLISLITIIIAFLAAIVFNLSMASILNVVLTLTSACLILFSTSWVVLYKSLSRDPLRALMRDK